MQRRENYLYVGMDLHKESHTAVLVNCWNEKLDSITIENKPSEFNKLAKRVTKKAIELGLSPIYGLENAYSHGRSLAVWLIEKGYVVKDINPALAYDQRKSASTFQKNDEYDAYAVATVLINQLNTLPDAKPEDILTTGNFCHKQHQYINQKITIYIKKIYSNLANWQILAVASIDKLSTLQGVEVFNDSGYFLELQEEPINVNNTEHLKRQREISKQLGL